ncbi:MAG: hypothetical protein ACYTBV_16320, partial [Planctomycetota bacterium]
MDENVRRIISRLAVIDGEGVVEVGGNWGSYARLLAECISRRLARPMLYVCPHIDDADNTSDDLHTFGAANVETLPAWEGAEELADATDEIRAERLRITLKVSSGAEKVIVTSSIQSLCQPVPRPSVVAGCNLRLAVDSEVSPEDVVEWLVDNGFERVDRVDLPGQFSRRGGIVDIYAPLVSGRIGVDDSKPKAAARSSEPVRVEFFGDTIESIRGIDLDTLRSSEQIRSISVVSAMCGVGLEEKELFTDILPANTIVIFEEPGTVEEVARVFLERVEDSERLYGWEQIYKSLSRFA